MQSIIDFLSFKSFITLDVLPICYIFGAFFAPFASWLIVQWARKRYSLLDNTIEQSRSYLRTLLGSRDYLIIWILWIAIFICMEIFWRILFEYLIGYMQMREELMKIHLGTIVTKGIL